MLADLERRRWHLWIVAAILLVSVSLAIVLVIGGAAVPTFLDAPALRWAFLGISAAFLIYAFEQERSLRRVSRTLLAEHEELVRLESRVENLTTLIDAARAVNSVLTPEEVFQLLLESAMDLADADAASVLLKVGDQLVVGTSRGQGAASIGTRVVVGDGPVGRAVVTGSPEHIDLGAQDHVRGLMADGATGGSAVIAPLEVGGRRVGVLAVGRTRDHAPFGPDEARAVVLFAEHAATAVANARRFEHERETVERLAEAAEKRSDFVAMMVHDLRAPLQAVAGYARLLEDRFERLNVDQRRQALGGVSDQTQRLERMVAEILRTSRAEAGHELRREPVDVARLVDETANTIRQAGTAVTGSEHEVRVTIEGEPGIIAGDPEALRHILINLLENAVKYSPGGGAVEVHVEDRDQAVAIHVADRGIGIPEEELAHVWDRFRQVDRPGAGGVGLGLYIVRTLTQAHGGRVGVQSREGGGTVFTVWLPRGTHGLTDEGGVAAPPSDEGRQAGAATEADDGRGDEADATEPAPLEASAAPGAAQPR